jgi:phage gp16-like protein
MLTTLKSHYADSTIAHIQARVADLGAIHAAKAQLKLSEADYQAMVKQASAGRFQSSAALDARSRARLIRMLKEKGYVESSALSERSKKIKANRLRDLGVIHMGKRALGLDEPAYRKLIDKASGGVAKSSGLLGAPQRAKVIEAMRERGFEFEEA